MATVIVNNPIVVAGDSSADRPTAPPQSIIFVDRATGVPSFYVGGSWIGILPNVTSVATVTALKAIAATGRYNGLIVLIRDSQSLWQFHSTSALTGDDFLAIAPTAGTGRWLRVPGTVDISIPVTSATADAAILMTLQAGMRMIPRKLYWDTSITWSGGASSTIGISSTKTGFSTKGDLLGGAAGESGGVLVPGIAPGIIGVGLDSVAKQWSAVFVSGDTFRFDRVTSAFTTGASNAHVVASLLLNSGS